MRKKRRLFTRRQDMLYAYIGTLALLFAAILLMPIASTYKAATMVPLYVSGALFWLGLLGTIGMSIIINSSRKKSRRFRELHGNLKRLGLIHFFSNKNALIMDVVMFLSLLAVVITAVLKGNQVLLFIFLALLVFSFGMHCMLNGVNYIYIKHNDRRMRNE